MPWYKYLPGRSSAGPGGLGSPPSKKELWMTDEGYVIPDPYPPGPGPDPLAWVPRRNVSFAAAGTQIQEYVHYVDITEARMLVVQLRVYAVTTNPDFVLETAVTKDHADRTSGYWQVLATQAAITATGDYLFTLRSDTDDMMKWLRWRVTDTAAFDLDFSVDILARAL